MAEHLKDMPDDLSAELAREVVRTARARRRLIEQAFLIRRTLMAVALLLFLLGGVTVLGSPYPGATLLAAGVALSTAAARIDSGPGACDGAVTSR